MSRSAFAALVAALIVCTPATRAVAGLADTPLPVLVSGQTTQYLYSVPGVISAGDFATYFSCTSTDTAAMTIAVELFAGNGGAPVNDATATSVSVGPGQTRIIATGSSAELGTIDINLATSVTRGSARILATSKKLACTAFIADRFNAPPTSMVQLTIIAKLKQKAAN